MYVHQFWWAWLLRFRRYHNSQKRPNFPFGPWTNLIDRNQLKKFMQICVDVICMYTNFCGRDLFGFGDTVALKNGQIFLSDHGLYSPWSLKNLIDWNRLKKFMQICVDVICMYTNFCGHELFSFGDTITLKNGQIFLSDHGL